MKLIQSITRDPLQKRSIILDDGSVFTFNMYFIPMQYAWFIRQLTYGDFTLNSLKISCSPNILYQYKNQLPFGIACFPNATNNPQQREPSQQDDFLTSVCNLYVLSSDEVADYTRFLSGQT